MNLIIDIGNTLTKIAIFDKNDLIEKKVFYSKESEHISSFIRNQAKDNSVILSAVSDYSESLKNYLKDKFYFIEFDEKTPLPIINKYKTPDTLGKDRLAAAVGGKHYYTDKNLLVINSGTCITYNFITAENEFLGGGISPGLSMRLKALNIFTSKLPLLEQKESFNQLIGTTTEESILSGVINGIIAEIEGIVRLYKDNYPNFKAILSGGDFIFLEKRLKSRIFAVPDLVLTGLNLILNYNVDKKNSL
jgi:type III pantothenate kinase